VPPFGGTSSPPLYYLNSLNEWRGCCLPPRMGFTLSFVYPNPFMSIA
jgi:hypothetical protein